MKIIKSDFFSRTTVDVAKSLLGQVLCRQINNQVLRGVIVEAEAYTQEDPSCHAYRGVTNRSKILFEKPGTIYVYFTYGMHHCVNVVTEEEGRGCAVLIRALEPLNTLELHDQIEYFDAFKSKLQTNGPAKLCKAFHINRELNGLDGTKKISGIWFEYGKEIPPQNIIQTTRIGIKVATDYPWRFYIKDNKFVSKK